jgi:hypothetical protein
MNPPFYLAHAGEEGLVILIPLVIIAILIAISKKKGPPDDPQ